MSDHPLLRVSSISSFVNVFIMAVSILLSLSWRIRTSQVVVSYNKYLIQWIFGNMTIFWTILTFASDLAIQAKILKTQEGFHFCRILPVLFYQHQCYLMLQGSKNNKTGIQYSMTSVVRTFLHLWYSKLYCILGLQQIDEDCVITLLNYQWKDHRTIVNFIWMT